MNESGLLIASEVKVVYFGEDLSKAAASQLLVRPFVIAMNQAISAKDIQRTLEPLGNLPMVRSRMPGRLLRTCLRAPQNLSFLNQTTRND